MHSNHISYKIICGIPQANDNTCDSNNDLPLIVIETDDTQCSIISNLTDVVPVVSGEIKLVLLYADIGLPNPPLLYALFTKQI